MPVVSSSGQSDVSPQDVFIVHLIYYFNIFHCGKASCYTTPSLHVAPIVYLPVFSSAGLLCRLLRPGRGGAAETSGDDGEQQLRLADSRL